MFFRRFYDDQLAQASYLLGCQATGQALVVDPNRHIEPYLRAAEAEGLRITHVTETHIHADFVSGARELARRAGARLLLSDAGGDGWRYGYAAEDGATLCARRDRFQVGRCRVRVMHTPGHTPEHLTFLVTDTASATEPMGALTGDFIFVGDVGRPDLLERAAGQRARWRRARGSSSARSSGLPRCRITSRSGPATAPARRAARRWARCRSRRWATRGAPTGRSASADEEEFVRAVLAGQPDPPRYFAR